MTIRINDSRRHERIIDSTPPRLKPWATRHVARKREIEEKRQVLFSIRLVDMAAIKQWECFDADSGKDMARDVREYFIPDFSEWEDEARFERSFARLLVDLKASAT